MSAGWRTAGLEGPAMRPTAEERGRGRPRCPSCHRMERSPFHLPSSKCRALPRCTKSTETTLASHQSQSPIRFFSGIASQQAMRCVVAGLTLAPTTTKHNCSLLSCSAPPPSNLAHRNKFRHLSARSFQSALQQQPLQWVSILHLFPSHLPSCLIYTTSSPPLIILISLTYQRYSGSISIPGLIR